MAQISSPTESRTPAGVVHWLIGAGCRSLADHDADGKMDRNEFSVACKLITMKLRGMEVPATLPLALQGLLTSPVAAPGAQFGGTGTTHHTVSGALKL